MPKVAPAFIAIVTLMGLLTGCATSNQGNGNQISPTTSATKNTAVSQPTPPPQFPAQWISYGNSHGNNGVYNVENDHYSWSAPMGNVAHGGVSVANGVVYVGSNDNAVYAFRAKDGKLLWKQTAFDNPVMTEPLVYDGLVFVGSGGNNYASSSIRGTGKNVIAALDAKTGKIVWQIPTQGENMPSFDLYNGVLYAIGGDRTLRAINPKTGKVEWTLDVNGVASMASINVKNNVLYADLGDPYQSIAVNLKTHQIIYDNTSSYTTTQMGLDDAPVSVGSGLVFTQWGKIINASTQDYQETVTALSDKTGKEVWSFTEPNGLKATPEEYEAAAPVYSGGIVYFGSPFVQKLYAVNAANGKEIWETNLKGSANQAPVVLKHDIIIGGAGGNLYVVNKQSGKLVGTYQLPSGEIFTNGAPVVVNNVIYEPVGNPKTKTGSIDAIPLTSITGFQP
ncbi:PQQ-binding-like beta-propeller repeat protein [Alicyclobacillus ferrooxydans]|nr:PQQ-binding-like beta-propeller repeat protein [Alicyclobacillus ferrooxydans]